MEQLILPQNLVRLQKFEGQGDPNLVDLHCLMTGLPQSVEMTPLAPSLWIFFWHLAGPFLLGCLL